MHRIDDVCNHNGQMEDVYSEFNKWSFESKLVLPDSNMNFVLSKAFQLKYGQ